MIWNPRIYISDCVANNRQFSLQGRKKKSFSVFWIFFFSLLFDVDENTKQNEMKRNCVHRSSRKMTLCASKMREIKIGLNLHPFSFGTILWYFSLSPSHSLAISLSLPLFLFRLDISLLKLCYVKRVWFTHSLDSRYRLSAKMWLVFDQRMREKIDILSINRFKWQRILFFFLFLQVYTATCAQ